MGPREQWRVPVLREMWGALHAGAGKRRRSADHERVWFQLTGYTLRPGFGYPLDEWRSEQTARCSVQGVAFHQGKAGLDRILDHVASHGRRMSEDRHAEIWNYLKPHLERRLAANQPKQQPKLKGIQPEGLDEMVRLAAALEHLDAGRKNHARRLDCAARLQSRPLGLGARPRRGPGAAVRKRP